MSADGSVPQTVFHRIDWPLTTERLTLRPITAEHVEPLHRFRWGSGVDQWIGWRAGDAAEFARRMLEPSRAAKTLVMEHDGQVIGDLMLAIGDGWSQAAAAERAAGVEAELGWTLDPAYGGRGLATEAVRALLAVCFDEREGLGLRRVTASCFAANERSWRLMERVGMRREQHGVADSLHAELGWLDGYTYALLASEWHASGVRSGSAPDPH